MHSVAFSQGSAATVLRCGGIFIEIVNFVVVALLGPFYGAIAVPSVTRCRRRCRRRRCGHRIASGVRQ